METAQNEEFINRRSLKGTNIYPKPFLNIPCYFFCLLGWNQTVPLCAWDGFPPDGWLAWLETRPQRNPTNELWSVESEEVALVGCSLCHSRLRYLQWWLIYRGKFLLRLNYFCSSECQFGYSYDLNSIFFYIYSCDIASNLIGAFFLSQSIPFTFRRPGSGCSTAVEHLPPDPEVRSVEPCGCWAFFDLLFFPFQYSVLN